MADALVLETSEATHAGSTPASCTIFINYLFHEV